MSHPQPKYGQDLSKPNYTIAKELNGKFWLVDHDNANIIKCMETTDIDSPDTIFCEGYVLQKIGEIEAELPTGQYFFRTIYDIRDRCKEIVERGKGK